MFQSIIGKKNRGHRNQKSQGMLEYVLLIGLAAIALAAALSAVSEGITDLLQYVSNSAFAG